MIPVSSHAREPGHDQCRSQIDAPGHDSQLLRAEAQEEIAKPRRSHTAAHLLESKAFDTVHIPARPNTFSRAVTPAAGYGGVGVKVDPLVPNHRGPGCEAAMVAVRNEWRSS